MTRLGTFSRRIEKSSKVGASRMDSMVACLGNSSGGSGTRSIRPSGERTPGSLWRTSSSSLGPTRRLPTISILGNRSNNHPSNCISTRNFGLRRDQKWPLRIQNRAGVTRPNKNSGPGRRGATASDCSRGLHSISSHEVREGVAHPRRRDNRCQSRRWARLDKRPEAAYHAVGNASCDDASRDRAT